jgi:hypothetical protein
MSVSLDLPSGAVGKWLHLTRIFPVTAPGKIGFALAGAVEKSMGTSAEVQRWPHKMSLCGSATPP